MAGGIILPYRGVMPRIDGSAFVAPGASIVGDVEIGARSSIWFGCVLRGDVAAIRIGAESNIQDGTVIHVSGENGQGTHIGDGVTVAHSALLHDCRLEDGCFIGMQACVMDGAVVESGSMVAAGALVTPGKRVLRGELWAGRPARLLRPLGAAELAEIDRVRGVYVRLSRDYLADGIGVAPQSRGRNTAP